MVAHPVPAAVTFLDVATFQTVDDSLGQSVIRPSTGDKGVECHVLVPTLIHVKRMNVELGEDFDTTAVDYEETRTDQNHRTNHSRQHDLHILQLLEKYENI